MRSLARLARLVLAVRAAAGLVAPRGHGRPRPAGPPRPVAQRRTTVARRAAADEGVVAALGRLREDLESLDADAAARPRVSTGEAAALATSVAAAAAAPFLENPAMAELGVPAAALVVAAVGVAAEYGGRVATATAKEVAAVALRTASEAEAALAAAERAKAACPLCAGLAAAAAAITLALPKHCPLLLLGAAPLAGAIAAAVGALAHARASSRAETAENLGKRRFASSAEVGATWRSQTEMVFARDLSEKRRQWTVALALLPTPLAGALCLGGSWQFRAVAAASVAATQAAYHVAAAEFSVAHAAVAVADKQRTAAIIDTYANQASRVGALLPFTSALAGLCAAAAAVVVEVAPAASVLFPALGAVCAAAATVSKACCEADASAAAAASRGLATSEGTGGGRSFAGAAVRAALRRPS